MHLPRWGESLLIVAVGWVPAAVALYLFGNAGDVRVITSTLGLGLCVAMLAVPTAWTLARAMDRGGALGAIAWYVGVISWFVPLFVHVSAWDALWGKLGWLVFWRDGTEAIVGGWWAAVWVHAMAAAPQVALLIWFGLAGGSRTYEEQALVEAGETAVFWNITLRRLAPWAVAGCAWILAVCAREIAVTDIYQIGTLAEEVYLGFSLGALDNLVGAGNADASSNIPSWPLSIAIVAWGLGCLGAGVVHWISIREWSEHWRPRRRTGWVGRRRGRSWLAGFGLCLIALVPLVNLIVRACFRMERIDGRPVAGYSIENGFAALSRGLSDTWLEIQWSTALAVVSGVLGICLAIAWGWLAVERPRWRASLMLTIVATMALPGPVIGLGLVRLFTSVDAPWLGWLYDRTLVPAMLATVIYFWPIWAMLVWVTLNHTARDALEHARLEGAGWWMRLWRMAIGQNRRSLAGCLVLFVALSWGELSSNQMVLPPGVLTVPRTMLGWLHSGVDERTAALTLIVIALTAMMTLLATRWYRWNEPSTYGAEQRDGPDVPSESR